MIFLHRKWSLVAEFMEQGTTINSKVYCESLKKLWTTIQNKLHTTLSYGVLFFHSNTRLHTAAQTQELLGQFGWEIYDHLIYNPNLALCDYHLFGIQKSDTTL